MQTIENQTTENKSSKWYLYLGLGFLVILLLIFFGGCFSGCGKNKTEEVEESVSPYSNMNSAINSFKREEKRRTKAIEKLNQLNDQVSGDFEDKNCKGCAQNGNWTVDSSDRSTNIGNPTTIVNVGGGYSTPKTSYDPPRWRGHRNQRSVKKEVVLPPSDPQPVVSKPACKNFYYFDPGGNIHEGFSSREAAHNDAVANHMSNATVCCK